MWNVTRNNCSLIPLIQSDFWLRDCTERKGLCQNATGQLGSTHRMHLNQNFPNSVLEFAVERESNMANDFFLCLFTATVHIAVYVLVFLCVHTLTSKCQKLHGKHPLLSYALYNLIKICNSTWKLCAPERWKEFCIWIITIFLKTWNFMLEWR